MMYGVSAAAASGVGAAGWASTIPGAIGLGAGGMAAHAISSDIGKRYEKIVRAGQEAGARDYTQAKSWKDIRKAAFRRGIKPPQMSRAGMTPMTLEEAAEIARRVRREMRMKK